MGKWISGGGVGESYEVNNEARNVESMSITSVTEVEGDANGKTILTNLT